MSEKSKSNVILGVVIVAVVAAIVIVVAMRPGEKAVDPVAEEQVDRPVAVSNSDVSPDADEPEEETEVESDEIEVEEQEQKEEKPEPVKEIAQTTEAPKKVADEIEDIMTALEYREDFCPKGYELADMRDMGPNPGFAKAEMTNQLSQELGADVEIQRTYLCVFSRVENEQMGYLIFELANHDDALALSETAQTKFAEKSGPSGETFIIRNCVVLVGYDDEVADLGNELMVKLKRAVNYTD